jgi:hypothetical protein
MKHEVFYQRIATKAKDSYDGLLYLHSWGTGYQLLIFPSHEKAKEFERKENERSEASQPVNNT